MLSDTIYLRDEDLQILVAAGGNDARTAVFYLCSRGAYILRDCGKNEHPAALDTMAIQQLQNLAKNEQDPHWQYVFANASVKANAVELISWLIHIAQMPEMVKNQETTFNSQYGIIKELFLAKILSAIGYLARVLLDKKRMDEATPPVAFLRERYAALQSDEEPSIIYGLIIGLGYLGDWEPILTHLAAGKLWMHKAAQNAIKFWVPTPLNKASVKKQREEAAIWIARRLRDRSDLSPQGRTTLERIKDGLETQLGRRIQAEDL